MGRSILFGQLHNDDNVYLSARYRVSVVLSASWYSQALHTVDQSSFTAERCVLPGISGNHHVCDGSGVRQLRDADLQKLHLQ